MQWFLRILEVGNGLSVDGAWKRPEALDVNSGAFSRCRISLGIMDPSVGSRIGKATKSLGDDDWSGGIGASALGDVGRVQPRGKPV